MSTMNEDITAVLFTEEQIRARTQELGSRISQEYEGKMPVLIGILKGGFMFMADLIRAIDIPLEVDFMAISSYGSGVTSSGAVKIRKDIDVNIEGRHVIVVEDIIDSGLSIRYIRDYLMRHKPASVKVCALLNKPEAHAKELKIDYVGFNVGNEFVVGYGLDYDGLYRNLPYIGILKESIYT
ncbi:MAG TPA: hypoxanthine phosphoribosyltransferase [Candidatus Cloacimonadota bacterium]|nr:hypoxanthine phosphoribosyltransferase [Candidatus Cloacimonadota bacterium]